MANASSFKLISKTSGDVLKTSSTLLDIWNYIRMFVNIPSSWNVEEFDGENFVDVVDAQYLSENFKTDKEVPLTVTDIN